jgi:hypothetical protein
MSPKSGQAGSAVTPIDPAAAEEADVADPGKVEKTKAEQVKKKSGKYGSVPVKGNKPPESQEEKETKKSWIEVEMIDEANQPVAGIRYRITLPDGETVAEGALDEKGLVRIDSIEPGTCKITFPDLDGKAYEPA